jgi:hypothetical protein
MPYLTLGQHARLTSTMEETCRASRPLTPPRSPVCGRICRRAFTHYLAGSLYESGANPLAVEASFVVYHNTDSTYPGLWEQQDRLLFVNQQLSRALTRRRCGRDCTEFHPRGLAPSHHRPHAHDGAAGGGGGASQAERGSGGGGGPSGRQTLRSVHRGAPAARPAHAPSTHTHTHTHTTHTHALACALCVCLCSLRHRTPVTRCPQG